MTDRNLPFFVYGTLRHGEPNYSWALHNRTDRELHASLSGAVMYDNGGFPYVARTDDTAKTVIGELMYVAADRYAETLQDLDFLEGYDPASQDNHYDRVIVTVNTDAGEVQAYVYVVADTFKHHLVRRALPVIDSGDWNDRARRRLIART